MTLQIVLYILSFVGIWIGAGLAISAVEKISKKSKLSYFAVSYLILGFFTSSSEISVGINSLLDKDPEIFVGNLVGASIVIFLLVIPLLALTGSNIHIKDELKGNRSILPLVVITLPAILAIDGKITQVEGFIAIGAYILATIVIETRKLKATVQSKKKNNEGKVALDVFKIVFGIALVFLSSKYVVDKTIYFSSLLNVSPFLISLLVISVGTNIPELSLVFRSLFSSSNQVAFGDFVGSASANTFLFGLFTLLNGQDIVLHNTYSMSLMSLAIATVLFYFFAKSKNTISRGEGFAMLSIYAVFVTFELLTHVKM